MYKRITLLLAAAGMAFVVTGCATSPEAQQRNERLLDARHIHSVNLAARKAGVDVIWVNPPELKSDAVARNDRDEETAAP